MDNTETVSIETLNYRLTAIEATLDELKNVLLDSKLQERDIEMIKDKIKELETSQAQLKMRVKALEDAPANSALNKWKLFSDTLFKLVITGAITALLIKIGLPA